jgi:hypothetical protein
MPGVSGGVPPERLAGHISGRGTGCECLPLLNIVLSSGAAG